MFKVALFLSLLISLYSNAQIEKQIIHQIEKANQRSVGLPKTQDPCADCNTGPKQEELFEKCVQVLCKAKGLKPYGAIPSFDYSTEMTKAKPMLNEVEAQIRQLQSVKEPVNIPEARAKLIEILKSNSINMNPENINFAMMWVTLTFGGKVHKYNQAASRFEIDEEKWNAFPLQTLNEINQKALRAYVQVYMDGLTSMVAKAKSGPESIEGYLKSNYPGLSKTEAAQQLAKDFRAEFKKFKSGSFGTKFGKAVDIDIMFPKELVDAIESGKDVPEMSLKELISERNNIQLFTNIYDIKKYEKLTDQIDADDLKRHLTGPQVAELASAKFKKEDQELAAKNENQKTRCSSIFFQNYMSLPNEAQISKLKAEIEKVKKELQSKWSPLYSTETQGKISQYLKDVEFFLPPEKNEYAQGFIDRVRRETQKKKRNLNVEIKDWNELAYLLSLTIYSDNFKTDAEKKSSDNKLCEQDKFEALSDANYTLNGKIRVSYTIAHALEMGRGVLAHELGHGISQIFKSKQASEHSLTKQQEINQCTSSIHGESGDHHGEEDFADLVASSVASANFACLFPQSYASQAVKNSSAKDTHSSHFYRLLHMEGLQKQNLPQECNQLLVEQKTPRDFQKCLPLVQKR